MKIYLTKNDVLEILAGHFGLEIEVDDKRVIEKQFLLLRDELYWEGNEEKA